MSNNKEQNLSVAEGQRVEDKETERKFTMADIKAAHYAGWYNGLENAYRHEFSWSEYKKHLEKPTPDSNSDNKQL